MGDWRDQWIYRSLVKIGPDSVYGAVNVGAAATELKVGESPLSNRVGVVVYNNGPETVYIGLDDDVTTATGLPIPTDSEREISLSPKTGVSLYGITETGASNVRLWEVK